MRISTIVFELAVLSRAVVILGSPTVQERTVNPACLKTVELSCLNLAANCLNSVNSGVCASEILLVCND